jgi:undecaprenyl-phosphate galactose phosphotransferase
MSDFVSSMTDDQISTRGFGRSVKSAFDRISALILLILASPLLLLISLLVSRDGGPVIFGHRRVGHHGAEFRCLKFRTMLTNGEEVLARLLAEDPVAAAEWAANHKLKNDPRVTRIGRILRVTSLDELPQLLNVVRGEMSMVGPRPIVEAEIKRYGRDINYYYRVKPGLTGLWQVSGRSSTSYRQRIDYDVCYVKTWSLWLDFVILLRTVLVILTREGSH